MIASLMNLAGPDMIIILLIVLVLFGAKKLPELAKGMGQAMKEFQQAKDDFAHEIASPRQVQSSQTQATPVAAFEAVADQAVEKSLEQAAGVKNAL